MAGNLATFEEIQLGVSVCDFALELWWGKASNQLCHGFASSYSNPKPSSC